MSTTAFGGKVMRPPLDVFAIEKTGTVWLGAVETLEQALEIARKAGTGSYFVFSQRTGHKTRYVVDTAGTIRSTEDK